MICNHYNIPYAEVAVKWEDIEGSKVNIVRDSMIMARDYVLLRIFYSFGIWKFDNSVTSRVN